MKIEHEQTKKKGSFFVAEDGKPIARLQYFHSEPGQITVYHTEVDPSLGGKGVGRDLVSAAVTFARDHDLKIVPTCSYAKSVIDKTPEFHDVLV